MSNAERRKQIIVLLQKQPSLSIRDLAAQLYASEASVRRDVAALEEEGLVRRIYGGVMLCSSENHIVPLSLRAGDHGAQKERLAKHAAELVEDGDTILLDASSTVYRMVRHLASRKDLTIITNNARIFDESVSLSARIYCTGGEYLRQNHAFAGPSAEAFLRTVWADKVFFSSQAVSALGEVSDHSEMETALRRVMLERSAQKICLMDDSKFGGQCRFRLCAAEDVDLFLSEKKPPWQ